MKTQDSSWLRSLEPPAIGGLLLVAAAVFAFAWANSPWASSYEELWQIELTLGAGSALIQKPLILWINDGLMAIFFLLVGLEIKRELLEGALSTRRRASLPLFAAIGGIAVPALVYALVNLGGDLSGWAVPAATDIAFALGILSLLGKRVPIELKIFLTAVAVVDDLGAILIIAVFFTESVALWALIGAGLAMAALFSCNRLKITRPAPYVLLGLVLWVFILKSGVHATVAGVLLASVIPAGARLAGARFVASVGKLAATGDQEDPDELAPDTVMHRVRGLLNDVESPLLRWEHALAPHVLFFIMPIFALANAGVTVSGGTGGLGSVGWGVALGLFLGKPIGVTLGAWFGVRMGWSDLSAQLTWSRLHAAAWLAGIGFTMSLFISSLALDGESALAAKLGLMSGSLAAGIIGTFLLLRSCASGVRRRDEANPDPSMALNELAQVETRLASLPRRRQAKSLSGEALPAQPSASAESRGA